MTEVVTAVRHLYRKKDMAIIKINSLVSTIHGSIGNLVLRQYQGKTVLSSKSIPKQQQSELQRKNRSKFRHASAWAKAALLDPDKKVYYKNKAIKLNLPNAYTAALRDFLRKGNIHKMNQELKASSPEDIKPPYPKKDSGRDIQKGNAGESAQRPTSTIRERIKTMGNQRRQNFCSVHYIQNIKNMESSTNEGDLISTYSDQ